jgi:hypothetical protein
MLTFLQLQVHGYSDHTGNFGISLQVLVSLPTQPRPENDSCDGALMLNLNNPALLLGSSLGATPEDVPSCEWGNLVSLTGIWYSVIGTGYEMTISLCEGTDYDADISIFVGSCSNLICIGYNNNSTHCMNGANAFTWFTGYEVVYYILVGYVFHVSLFL